MVYVHVDISLRIIECENLASSFKCLVRKLSVNLKKWLLICSYSLHRNSIKEHIQLLSCYIDQNIQKYENILKGDYNSEVTEASMQEFCKSYFLKNVKKPTCFKNLPKPTYVDLIITNKSGMFQNAKTYETRLSDFHKLVVSIMKVSYKKRLPHGLIFQVSILKFLNENLANNTKLDYNSFEEIVLNLLSSQGPFKKRMVQAN